jgi:arginyl-tRNA synthetase
MYKNQIEKDLKKAIEELGFKATDTVVYISENVLFGDYTTNSPLQLSKQNSGKNYQLDQRSDNGVGNPRDIANAILEKFGHPSYLERIDIAGPGFINFFLKDEALLKGLKEEKESTVDEEIPERILVEYASPNAFKPLHIGHLRNIITGESISRILNYSGKEIFRVTYTSEIGPPVAKTIWGIRQNPDKFLEIEKNATITEKVKFLGDCYVAGNTAYENNPKDKEEIDRINIKLYQEDEGLTLLWQKTRSWSLAYLQTLYSRLGSEFDAEIFESDMAKIGAEVVQQYLGSVFVEDQGAIIFEGEKYGLHNRVFITSKGTPTYEAKDLGVNQREQELFPYDRVIHVVGSEQTEYFKVITKAIEQIDPKMTGRKIHQPYGFVSLSTGKMSSRLGNVILAEELIDQVKQEIKANYSQSAPEKTLETIAIAAVKFAYLKFGLTSDIAFDINQAVSLHGDSGPYLLYTYARINSILEKAQDIKPAEKTTAVELEPEEREVLRQLDYFEPIAKRAAEDFSPNDLANYLLNLTKAFNQFYEKHPVLGSKKQDLRLKIATRVGERIKLGAYLLGFEVLPKM